MAESRNALRIAVVGVFAGLMATLDATVVSVALRTITRDLGTSLPVAQWVMTGYLLALAVTLPLSAWLVNRLGLRRTFFIAVGAFAFTSVAAAIAPTIGWLIATRILQGGAGGLLVPLGQIIVTRVTPDEQLGRVMGVVGAPASLGPVLGPVLGSAVLTIASWQWVFLINLPIAGIALLFGARRLPTEPAAAGDSEREQLDVVGLLLLGTGLALGLYLLATISRQAAPLPLPVTIGIGAICVGLLASFGAWSLHRPRSGPNAALVDLPALTRGPFGPAVLLALLTRVVADGSLLLVTLFLQHSSDIGPLGVGLLLAAQGVGATVGLQLGGRLNDRRGGRTTGALGATAFAATTCLLLLAPNLPTLAVLLLLRGLANSFISLPPIADAYLGLDRTRAPRATTTLNIAQRLGSPIGTAVFIALLGTSTAPYTTALLATAVLGALLLPLFRLLPRAECGSTTA